MIIIHAMFNKGRAHNTWNTKWIIKSTNYQLTLKPVWPAGPSGPPAPTAP